jgi:hypothetical protein
VVQVVKAALRKLCDSKGSKQWDRELCWVALGYRCSRQASTGFSPYQLLYAREPVFPSGVQQRMQECIDFDSKEAAAVSVLRRAELLKQRIPIAAENLKAAQHRDTLWYQQRRSGGYQPGRVEFQVGDFVYLRKPREGCSLTFKVKPLVLRVKQLKPSGVVVVQDRSGAVQEVQPMQLAMCHLPGLDGTLDHTLLGEDQSARCRNCGDAGSPEQFMFCDGCNEGWHTFCCEPPYEQVPEGLFICELCRAKGVTEQQLEAAAERQQQILQQPRLPDLTALFPDAEQRRRDQQARELHGRVCKRVKGVGGT